MARLDKRTGARVLGGPHRYDGLLGLVFRFSAEEVARQREEDAKTGTLGKSTAVGPPRHLIRSWRQPIHRLVSLGRWDYRQEFG